MLAVNCAQRNEIIVKAFFGNTTNDLSKLYYFLCEVKVKNIVGNKFRTLGMENLLIFMHQDLSNQYK
jgi:hypothetical protein